MWQRINRWAKDNPLGWGIVTVLGAWALSNATVETGSLMSDWQYDIAWFLMALGWGAVSVALAMLSKNLWDVIEARQEGRRQEREDRGKKCEEKRQPRQAKHLLAVKIWEECQDNVAEILRGPNAMLWQTYDSLISRVAGKLRGLDPFLDDYDSSSEVDEHKWVEAVCQIIGRTNPSAEALDRIRKRASVHLERVST